MKIVTFIKGFWRKVRTSSLIRDSASTTFFNTAGKAVGFLIPFFIAAWFGVTRATDAFFFAYGIIIFISAIFYPVMEKVIVPFIAKVRSDGGDVGRFIGSVSVIITAVLIALSLIIILVIKPVLSIITRFDEKSLELIFIIILETIPLIFFLTWTSMLAGAINAHKRFILPALSPAFRAVVCLLIIYFLKDLWGVHVIALGYVIGEIIRFLILFIFVFKKNLFKIRLSFKINKENKRFLRVSSYQVLGMLVVGLTPIIDKTMASWLEIGSVSILEYADRLYMIPTTFLSTGVMVVLLSYWSERYFKLGKQRLKEDMKKALIVVTLIAIFIAAILIVFSRWIALLAFGRGEFDMEKIPEVSLVFIFYLAGFFPYIAGRIFVQAHLVLSNTKALLKCGIYISILNIILNYIFMKFFGVAGIALATSFTSIFSLCYLGIVFFKKLGKEG